MGLKYFLSSIALVMSLLVGFSQDAENTAAIRIDLTGTVHPWSHLRVNNDPGNFQFAIVADRTGGHRTGVFEDAVNKLNLLQPEFVVSIGDLIEGYTRDEQEIYSQWDEFNGFISRLEMPFFYVPGNHDYINDIMAKIWEEKFGPSYYHFIYKDVLFLCLNTEEATRGEKMGGIEKPQYDYVKKVLEDHPGVRWTLFFMHQPLWIFDNTGYWKELESLLGSRQHTVFAGHNHHYVKYKRNNGKYVMLATTGGASQLRGPNYGEFEHVVWVSMTDEGPVTANLLLEGVWHEDVMTDKLQGMVQAEHLRIEPMFVEKGEFEGSTLEIKIINDENIPMWTFLSFNQNAYLKPEIVQYQKEIPPNSVESLEVKFNCLKPIKPDRITPLILYSWHIFTQEDGREFKVEKHFGIAPVKKEYCMPAEMLMVVDGELDDWPALPFEGNFKSVLSGDKESYSGDFDAQYEFNEQHDQEYLYIGISVWDDELVIDKKESLYKQDALMICLDGRPVGISSNNAGDNSFTDYACINFAPSPGRKDQPLIYQQERLPEGTLIKTSKSIEGFNAEVAVPVEFLTSNLRGDWKNFRLNIVYYDYDKDASRTGIWWRPNWSSEQNYIGSGMFFRNIESPE